MRIFLLGHLSRTILALTYASHFLAMESNLNITKGPLIQEGGIPTLVHFEPNSADIIKTKNHLLAAEFKFRLIRLLLDPSHKRNVDKIYPTIDFIFLVSMADKDTKIAFNEPFHVTKVNDTPIQTYISNCAAMQPEILIPSLINEETELTLQRTAFIDGAEIKKDILEKYKGKVCQSENTNLADIKPNLASPIDPNSLLGTTDHSKKTVWMRIVPRCFAFFRGILACLSPYYWFRIFKRH